MKLSSNFFGKLLALPLMAAVFVSCSSDDDDSNLIIPPATVTTTPVVSGIKLSQSTLNLGVNETTSLKATVNGSNLSDSDKKVAWTSSRPEIASVDGGEITALAAGSARITATSVLDNTKSAYCDVTVEKTTVKDSTKNEKTVGTSAASYSYSYTGSSATIYIYSKSGGLNFYGIKVGDNLWLPSDFGARTYSSTTELASNGVTFTAVLSGSDTMSIDASNATIGGTKFSGRFKTSGGGSQTSRCLKISVEAATEFVFYACSSNSKDERTMVIEVVEKDAGEITVIRPSSITLDKTSISLERTDDDKNPATTLTATLSPENITEGYDQITWSSSNESVATVKNGVVTATGEGSATITAATSNGKTAVCEVTVTSLMSGRIISASDTPVGYASIDTSKFANFITVSTKTALVNYAKKGGYVIYVNGMIDMSEEMLPTSGGGSTTALDSFVKSKSTYSTYAAYKAAYVASCSKATNDESSSKPESTVGSTMWTLNKAYGDKIKLTVESNTAIIGLNSSSGIKGGTIQVSGVSNVVIRNILIQDAYDPFPHHEKNDGYNAQWDGITIQGNSSNIWIDHCTIEDTMNIYKVSTGGSTSEYYQTYDGACDMKGDGNGITISYCKFYNHDKTMLIGSSDDEGSNSTRKITLQHNYFLDCEQRLPMVRNTTIHIFNNYFDFDSNGFYKSNYAVGVRAGSIVYAENNYFGSGIQNSFTAKSNSKGTLYSSGDSDNSSKKINSAISSSGTTLFSSAVNAYDYSSVLETADKVPADLEQNAGAGVWTVKQ